MPLDNFPETFEGADAATVINGVVKKEMQRGGERSPDKLAASLREASKEASKEAQAGVQEHIAALQRLTQGSVIDVLPAGVGGQWDGSKIRIATGTVLVGAGDVSETVARMNETGQHEAYHEKHDHTASLIVGASAEGDTVATIGGTAFTQTELIEGLTVLETGHEFVSADYRGYEGTLVSAVSASDVTMDDVRKAVNLTKDLTLVDDASRSKDEAAEYQMAA